MSAKRVMLRIYGFTPDGYYPTGATRRVVPVGCKIIQDANRRPRQDLRRYLIHGNE